MGKKILDRDDLERCLPQIRRTRARVVFTNGCFDLLHAGHVRYLAEAKSYGHVLIVGLNSDRSVKTIKGAHRPVVSQRYRAEVLAALACVDIVVIFDQADPLDLIRQIKPDVLVKGADWAESEIVGAEFVRSCGGRVVRIELVPELSTSAIIEAIVDRYK